MVPIKSLAAVAILAVSTTTASPSAIVPRGITYHNGPMVQACIDKDWRGNCAIFTLSQGVCQDMPAAFNDAISSIRNLKQGIYNCVWWQHGGCNGDHKATQVDADLSDNGGGWNDKISAIKCS